MTASLPLEQDAINDRRAGYFIARDAPQCGLALSGGGIRSATFSLGLLRGLSSLHLLQRLDYLSTVSGGGYAGAFFCGLFSPREEQKAIVEPKPESDLLGQDDAQKALAYLRQSGRYLTPTGGRDYAFALTMLTRNWLALVLVVGAAVLLDELVLDFVRIGCAIVFEWVTTLLGQHRRLWTFVSPLLFALPILLWLIVGYGWAYWLTLGGPTENSVRPPLVGTILILVASVAGVALLSDVARFAGVPILAEPDRLGASLAGLVASLAILALGSWFLAGKKVSELDATATGHRRAIRGDRIRHRLAVWQSGCASVLFWIALLAIADMLTFLFLALEDLADIWRLQVAPLIAPLIVSLTAAAVPTGQWLIKKVASTRDDAPRPMGAAKPSWFSRLATPLTWLIALFLAIVMLAFWGGIAHQIMWREVHWLKTDMGDWQWLALWAGLVCLLFVLLTRETQGFVNLSSLASFYADRLCRAYLGAGNRERIATTDAVEDQAAPVQADHPNDDLGLHYYYTKMRGGPVHLINVTINQTHGKGPATVQRDRHGLNLTISPDGFSYSEVAGAELKIKALGSEAWTAHQAARAQDQSAPALEPPGQSLPLSTWIGISGAAFSTGLGSQTSLARSLLAFLANVRLGFWWQADRANSDTDSSYINLRREMLASFPGTERPHWYLSDGGHFENTGVYELVRRRVPLIIVSDNGCDPTYGFEDIANLVRKCRIDFGAQIDFLDEARLDRFFADDAGDLRSLFAEPAQFALETAPPGAVAMLGRIDYGQGVEGTLLAIKPRLTRDGPSDLMRYLADNPKFPQQTTFDQSFDEAQWESYYELGRRIAIKLFEKRASGGVWQPADVSPVNSWVSASL